MGKCTKPVDLKSRKKTGEWYKGKDAILSVDKKNWVNMGNNQGICRIFNCFVTIDTILPWEPY